jgi:hypothetical protein
MRGRCDSMCAVLTADGPCGQVGVVDGCPITGSSSPCRRWSGRRCQIDPKGGSGAVPDPCQCLGPGVEVGGQQPVGYLPGGVLGQRRVLKGGARGEAGQAVREQGGQGVRDRLTGPGAHRLHHPRGCATRPRLRSRRATHPVREDRSPTGETVSRPGTAAAPGHDKPRTFADGNLHVSVFYAALCVWPLVGC